MIIATLIAADRLDRDVIWHAATLLEDARLKSHEWSWLDQGDAADILVEGAAVTAAQVRRTLEGNFPGVDIIVQPAEHRNKRLLVADMDSTVIGQECIDELADYAGIKDDIAAITERAMQGELDFAAALRERVALLAGLEESTIARCLAERVRPNPGASTLVRTMRARGAACLLISGGFLAFAKPVADEVGFDRVIANRLIVAEGRLAGVVGDPIVDADAKRDSLVAVRDELGLSRGEVLAVGDGANDRLMIEEAGLGIAYRAKPALADVADARLDHHGLDALLWAQGIPRSQWIGG